MRDRLIELLEDIFNKPEKACPRFNTEEDCSGCPYDKGVECDIVARYTDHLLANGVIVPPCKVGDVVYVNPKTWGGVSFVNYNHCFIHSQHFLAADVVSIVKNRKQNLIKLKVYNRTTYTPEYRRYPISSIGKTVFLTREEAEAALKGGVDNA